MPRKIKQPPKARISMKNFDLSFNWAPDFSERWSSRYNQAQAYVDRAVLQLSDKFITRKSGRLSASGSQMGSGAVRWSAPYAKYVYFGRYMGKNKKNPINIKTGKTRYMRAEGLYWFRRMKGMYGKAVIKRAKRIVGGGTGNG